MGQAQSRPTLLADDVHVGAAIDVARDNSTSRLYKSLIKIVSPSLVYGLDHHRLSPAAI